MLKFGAYRLDQVREDGLYSKLSKNRISYQLLRTNVPPSKEEVAVFERIMQHIQLSSGIYRTTFRGRFQEFDQFLNAILAKRFPRETPLAIHDWAASDCLTSREWAATVLDLFPKARLTASDLTLFFLEASTRGEAFVYETNGNLLQYIRPPFVIRMQPPEPSALIVNRLLQQHATKKFLRLQPSWKLPAEWLSSSGAEGYNASGVAFRKLPLVHPEAVALQQANSRFAVRQHSAFEPLASPVDVIRTMNILNLSYFSKERLAEGIAAVLKSLVPGGVWIVGRTHKEQPPEHHVSVFVKEGSGFTLLERYGQGSEVDDIVPSVRL